MEYFEFNGQRFVEEYSYYRVPHDIERVRMYVTGTQKPDLTYMGTHTGSVRKSVMDLKAALPEVYRVDPNHSTLLSAKWQWFWRHLNPKLSDKRFATLFDSYLAWCNGTGNGKRNNYITGDLGHDKDIAFDQARLCGGAIVKGRFNSGRVMIKSILTNDPVPDPVYLIAHPEECLWYWGTSVNPSGQINLITREGVDGQRYPVRIPILTALPIYLPANQFHPLSFAFSEFPDARWIV